MIIMMKDKIVVAMVTVKSCLILSEIAVMCFGV